MKTRTLPAYLHYIDPGVHNRLVLVSTVTTIEMAELAIPPVGSLTPPGPCAALLEWCVLTCLLICGCLVCDQQCCLDLDGLDVRIAPAVFDMLELGINFTIAHHEYSHT